jgi:glycosyltransferase involved in cell wall biosynthesis
MRFLHVIPSVDRESGGPIEALRQIGMSHQKYGHVIEVACVDAQDSPFLHDLPFPIHALGPGRTSYAYSAKLTNWLRRHRAEFDAVIVHGVWQFPTDAVRAALSGHVPYFVYTHGMLDPWFNQRYLFKHIKKTLFWHARLRRDLDEATGVIFTTEEEMERSICSFYPFHWKGIVAPLGIDDPPGDVQAPAIALDNRFPEWKEDRFLLFFGRIHPKKGCDLLLHAFSRIASEFPDLHLVMAGPGNAAYLASLQRIVNASGLANRVKWTGMISGPAKWGLLRAAEAFVLPSHQENFGIAAVEVMAVNTPVLISDKVQIWREVLRSGAGMVEPDSLEGTERLLRRWLAEDVPGQARFRKAAGACYRARFTAEQASRILLNGLMARLRSSRSGLDALEPFSDGGKWVSSP